MRMNEYKQELIKQHMQSDQEYCYYCLEPNYGQISCCQENHFVTFGDLYPEDQQEIINAEFDNAYKELK